MKKLEVLFFSFFIILFLFSCNDEIEQRVFYGGLDYRLEKYAFSEKKYWIFENDSTGILDSIEIVNVNTGEYRYEISNNQINEIHWHQMDLKNFSTNLEYNYILSIVFIRKNGSGENDKAGQLIYSFFDEPGDVSEGLFTIEILPSMTINGNTFYGVTETKVAASLQSVPVFEYDTYHYLCDSIGIIKTVTDSGNGNFESWSLKRWGQN